MTSNLESIHQTSYIKKAFKELWKEIEPINPLKKSFFISQDFLIKFRFFSLVVNTITFIWTMTLPGSEIIPTHFHLFAFLTMWGFFICYAYSIFALIWIDVPNNSLKWRVTYILGEIGFALELMICPFFFTVIFPIMLEQMNMTFWDIFYNVLIHFIVPVLIWMDILFSDIAFPKGHRVILHIVIFAYLLNNLIWTLAMKRPVYLPVDWVTPGSYVLKFLASLTVIGGFLLGGWIHRWKKEKYEKQTGRLRKEK